ncbi:MAG: hypothetical protein MRERV_31c013 [Mycoplasmataceae bacterium RV_VA103A]|nr:MAG: hypothetical protein MRERV_31c013 [Mycoplasmataceae bacterium RV_VA103A]
MSKNMLHFRIFCIVTQSQNPLNSRRFRLNYNSVFQI